jgi:hypothetical protein
MYQEHSFALSIPKSRMGRTTVSEETLLWGIHLMDSSDSNLHVPQKSAVAHDFEHQSPHPERHLRSMMSEPFGTSAWCIQFSAGGVRCRCSTLFSGVTEVLYGLSIAFTNVFRRRIRPAR